MNAIMDRIEVVDSHTAGEPTRVIVRGGPDLGGGTLSQRLDRFRDSFDLYRSAVVNEPRGSDVWVGALLCPPHDPTCASGVIFFNNVGYLGMCGHGMIGVIATLKYLGRIGWGPTSIETPVGVVSATLNEDGSVSVENVVSRRVANRVTIQVDGVGEVVGDVAWGGNWFFLVIRPEVDFSATSSNEMLRTSMAIREAVNQSGYPLVDHIELFGVPCRDESNSRNFVLCPGGQFDRSPCGTGTSAKLACLAADGRLMPGKTWIQEGVLGTVFQGSYRWSDHEHLSIVPTISGTAHIVSESTLLLNPSDPFCWGIPPAAG